MKNPLLIMDIRMEKPSNGFGIFPNRNSGLHQGWDLAAAVGTPTFAISNGTITYFEKSTIGLGNHVILKFTHHFTNYFAVYAHLDRFAPNLKKGEIKEGDPIGFTGKSGNASTLPTKEDHLHFEIRVEKGALANGVIPGRMGLAFRIDPGEILGYHFYSSHL